jgi:RNA polymerase sigma-70 factor (ECF subfamily)
MELTDEHELAQGLRAGQTVAWQALYDAHAVRLWRSVSRQMPGGDGVADVVQETFLAAARSARQYDAARGTLWMWLCGIARQQVALYYRRRQRHDRLSGQRAVDSAAAQRVLDWMENRHAAPADALAAAESASLVREALSELPADYETLLTGKYFDELSVDELAAVEGSTATATRSKLARARRAFRDAFLSLRSNSRTGSARQQM